MASQLNENVDVKDVLQQDGMVAKDIIVDEYVDPNDPVVPEHYVRQNLNKMVTKWKLKFKC